MRDQLGVGQFLFGADFPHWEGTWPNTADWIKVAFSGVEETEARRILGENAIEVYGLDRQALAAVAERIGPDSSELFGPDAHREVAPALVDVISTGATGSTATPRRDWTPLPWEAAIDEDLEVLTAAR